MKETMRLVYVASPYAAFKSGKVNADLWLAWSLKKSAER